MNWTYPSEKVSKVKSFKNYVQGKQTRQKSHHAEQYSRNKFETDEKGTIIIVDKGFRINIDKSKMELPQIPRLISGKSYQWTKVIIKLRTFRFQ